MNTERGSSRRGFLRTAAGLLPVAAASTMVAADGEEKRRIIAGPAELPFSSAVVHERLVFVSGSIGRDPKSGALPEPFAAQCRNVFDQMKAKLRASGSGMHRVLRCSCYLTDVADFPKMNELFAEYFPDSPPARSTVVVKALVVDGAKVEIDCVASL
jgi:2-iminobutanoate/2-iminopropanoate deaminase